MNKFHVHKKLIWSLYSHHPFQNTIGHFDWNTNFGSTSQGPNFINFHDFEVRPNALESLRCLIQMLCWKKFHNLKRNTCDNTKRYRSLSTKTIEFWKFPTSSPSISMMQASNGKVSNIKVVYLFRMINLDIHFASFRFFMRKLWALKVELFQDSIALDQSDL